jgi:hypothetical protein
VKNHVSIIGAGINGLLTAFYIANYHPELHITIYEADSHPVDNKDNKGTTLGSKDARHVTGSESICFESSVHHEALRNHPNSVNPGWLLKGEKDLSPDELDWRDKFEKLYTHKSEINDLDYAHARLNYRGLEGWHNLANEYPEINKHFLSKDFVEVYFESEDSFLDDLKMEKDFCSKYYPDQSVRQANNPKLKNTYESHLLVPGMSLRVKSLALSLIKILESKPQVDFHWNRIIENTTGMKSNVIIWTIGSTHKQPAQYQEQHIQGIVGCWATIKNPGYTKPFKIASPVPSAYINLTPDAGSLHVSGGFGWLGNCTDRSEVERLSEPVAKHLIDQIQKFLDVKVGLSDIEYCIRPSTPNGLPLMKAENRGDKKHIYISGSSKSGTTHAPILSQFVLDQI